MHKNSVKYNCIKHKFIQFEINNFLKKIYKKNTN